MTALRLEGSKELAHVLRWRDAVTRAWQAGCLSDADALHLLVLVQFADRDGRLKRIDRPRVWPSLRSGARSRPAAVAAGR